MTLSVQALSPTLTPPLKRLCQHDDCQGRARFRIVDRFGPSFACDDHVAGMATKMLADEIALRPQARGAVPT